MKIVLVRCFLHKISFILFKKYIPYKKYLKHRQKSAEQKPGLLYAVRQSLSLTKGLIMLIHTVYHYFTLICSPFALNIQV